MTRDHEAGAIPDQGISRRQFVIVVCGTVAVAAASGYGITVTAGRSGVLSAAHMPPGTITLLRAVRGARLTSGGTPALAAPGPAEFLRLVHAAKAGSPLGTADIDSASVIQPAGGTNPRSQTHGDGGRRHGASSLSPQPENLTWGDVVVLEVEVFNDAKDPVLFSPGQLRLKCEDGVTVAPLNFSRGPGPVSAGAREPVWVSYLAPSDATAFSLEFTDPIHDERLALGLPSMVPVQS